MRLLLHAEAWWLSRRRAPRVMSLLAVTCAVALPLARWRSTSDDVERAVADAERDAADAAARGVEIPAASFYVEPRYELASQLPLDLAGLSLGLALLALVTAAVAVGGEWRAGTVRLSFPSLRDRSPATAARIVVWWATGTAVGAVSLAVCTAALVAVGLSGGLSDGFSPAAAAGVAARGTLLVGAASAAGAAAASIVRSDVVVVAVALTYVVVVEILMVGLRGGEGLGSPGSRAHMVVAGIDVEQPRYLPCGSAPRCPVVHELGWGSPATYAAVAAALMVMTLVAVWSARRPLWRTQ